MKFLKIFKIFIWILLIIVVFEWFIQSSMFVQVDQLEPLSVLLGFIIAGIDQLLKK